LSCARPCSRSSDELQRVHGPYLTRAQINAFSFDGQPLSLMVQNGIRTPSRWTDPLTITSTRRDEAAGGYRDEDRGEGLRLYRYMRERSSAAPALNRSLDHAAMSGRPLVYFIEVNEEILEEIDGPMLRHGLQERHGRQILTPRHQRDHPDRDRLAWKYSRFRDRIA